MGYKDILVLVDEAGKPDVTIRAATALAESQGAHLTGLYAMVDPIVPLFVDGPVPQEMMTALRDQAEAAAQRGKDLFEKAVGESTLSIDFRSQQATPARVDEVIASHARHADLTVLTQSEPDRERAAGNDMPEEVILQSGRPVLVVPYVGIRQNPGKNVMVCWDGSREAARAMNDAMPILKKAEKVTVMSVNPKAGSRKYGEVPGADIGLHLARHGLKVEVSREDAGDMKPDQVILSRAAELDIDMLVLGAYGTPRLQERVFGGVTRTILHDMTVPVLFAH